LELTLEEHQINFNELDKRYNDLLQQIDSLQTDNQRFIEQIQQYEITLIQKDDLFKTQQDLTQQFEQRYLALEEKHNEQHTLMIKLSSHLAAKESETTDSSTNETWNTILAMNNYLRVENTRLTDDVERIRLENAHVNERNQTLEQLYSNNQEIIDELKSKNQSLQILQDRFDHDQKEIHHLQEKYLFIEQEKQTIQQEYQIIQTNMEQLNQQTQLLQKQLKQSEEKTRANDEQLTVKTAEIQRQGREIDEFKGRITKLESDNQELKQMTIKLKQIAIKYKTTATAAAASTTTTTAPTTSTDADELLTTGSTEIPTNRPLPVDLSEKMNKLRDALVAARTIITSQQTRMTQMTNELTRVKQSRISTDQTEIHTLVDNIRQTYETELNDLKHVIQLFDSTDTNEHMAEILRLRKRIDELTANKSTSIPSSTTKQSEDVTPKPVRPQAFASHTTQEPAISRVAPMAPATGRQIGVATPMTASVTPTTTSTPLWTGGSNTETPTTQATTPIEHPTSQITTAAGVNLLMKRTRTDDPEHKSMESTLKRTKAETENNPLIAHVEPQVREQQQQPIPIQEQQPEPTDTNMIDTTRNDIIPITVDNEGNSSIIDETISTDPCK
jgi:myosin heavy subunit